MPPFFAECIISDDLCDIIIRLLHPNAAYRFDDINEVRVTLETLRDEILASPPNLRAVLGHPLGSPEGT